MLQKYASIVYNTTMLQKYVSIVYNTSMLQKYASIVYNTSMLQKYVSIVCGWGTSLQKLYAVMLALCLFFRDQALKMYTLLCTLSIIR